LTGSATAGATGTIVLTCVGGSAQRLSISALTTN
jgi:hypothetical protein